LIERRLIKMKFNFKKIASIVATTVMLGSTVAFAAAAAWPAPFVNNGAADSAVVYGATSADLTAAADLGAALDKSVTANSGTLSGTGDQAKIEKSSSKFQYGGGVQLYETSLDDKDLPTLLADGTFMDDDNDEFDYKQTLDLANLTLGLFDDDGYKRDTPTVGFDVSEGTYIMAYTLDFIDNPLWVDLETTDLPIMGKNYYVLDAVQTTKDSLTLLDSAETKTLGEGETATITVDGKSYEVKVDFVSSTPNARFVVNGETTNSLANGATQRLAGGAYIGVKEVLYTAKDTGTSKVEFSIGAGKLILTNGEDVELNDENIDNLVVTFVNSTASKLDKITLNWSAETDSWITPDSQIEMPGFNAVKMSFTGMNYPKEQSIIVQADGDDNIVLSNFPMANGVTETINLLYSNGTNFTLVGKDSNNKFPSWINATAINFTKNVDDYFAVTYLSGEDAESYLVRATNWDDADYPDNVVDFEYLTSSGWKSLDVGVNRSDEVTVGDAVFTVSTVSNESSSAYVNLIPGTNTYFNRLVSSEGLEVILPKYIVNSTTYNGLAHGVNCTASAPLPAFGYEVLGYSITLSNTTNATNTTTCTSQPATYGINFSEEDKDDAIIKGANFTVNVGLDSDSEVYVTSVAGDGTAYEIGDTNIYRSFVSSALATEVLDDQSGDHEKVTLIYHGGESYGNVFVTAPTVTTGAAGSIKVVKDTEIDSVKDKNLLVVGGSCINTVAAKVLGSTTPLCGAAWGEKTGAGASGKFLVQVAASPYNAGKIAMLVAGYDAADTVSAVAKVKEGKESTAVGKTVYPLATA
jgi:hypothetical protein